MDIIYLMLVICCTLAEKYALSQKNDIGSSTTSVSTFVTTSTLSSEVETDENITTETILTTTCEANSSCSLSPLEPNTNNSAGTTATITSNFTEKHHRTDVTASGTEFCTCNLQLNVCDVNCCCDQDCSNDDKLIFHHCESENIYYDTRYCDYMKYIYINNTPFQWHVNQNGLFCVLKSNLPPSYTLQRKQPLTSFEVAEQEKEDKFLWPQSFKKKDTKFNISEDFVYGNNVWIIHRNRINKLQLPKKYFSNTCIWKEDILNLKKVKTECSQIDISEENNYLSFRNYFQNITVVANPSFLNISKYKNIQECPRNICLSIVPKICHRNFNNCQNIPRNDSRLDFKCNFDIRKNKNYCENAVKDIKYNFYHNGTKGYTRVELLGVLDNVSYEFGVQHFEFFQAFEVKFLWINETRNFSALLSGNPGYLIGKPILSGNLVNVANTTKVTLKIERYFNDYLGNFLVLPENVKGNCILNGTYYLPIEFGYNILIKCKFSTTVFNRKKYYNGSEICREVQKVILKMWGISEKNKTVGMFGNANADIPEDWIKIMYSTSIDKLLNKTSGRFDSANTTLTCFGLVNKLIVDIYHSRIDFKTLLNQEKILGVTYSFGGFINKTLLYNKQKNSTYLEIDLESQVVFYDISVQKQKKLVDPPSFQIRLPYDFFYPFIKMDSGVEVWSANIFLYIVCLVSLFIK